MREAIPTLPQYVFMAWCLVKHRDNFAFTFIWANALHFSLRGIVKGTVRVCPMLNSNEQSKFVIARTIKKVYEEKISRTYTLLD
jgi:hypothetical protein